MDTSGKTARKKRCTAQADASRTSFTEAALSRLGRLWPESALLGARKGWKSLLGLKRTDPAAPPLLQGHTLRQSWRRARVESAGEPGGPPRWMARPAGQRTASRPRTDPFSVPCHCWLAGSGFPPGPAQRAPLISATSSRSRRPPELRSLPRTFSDALLPRAAASGGRPVRSGSPEPGKRGESGFPASSAQRALAFPAAPVT